MSAKKTTIKEIADLANVSPATVSLVLNNKSGVSAQTRKKVQHILESRHYIPQRSFSSASMTFLFLKYKEHGMIVEENQGFIPAIIDYIEHDCSQKGIHLLTRILDKKKMEANDLPVQEIQDADGLLVLGTELQDDQIMQLQKFDKPCIVVDNHCSRLQVSSVVMANEEIVSQAVAHLHQLGHRKIGYLCSNVEISNFCERRTGFFSSIRELRMQMSCRFLLKPTLQGAYTDLKRQLQSVSELPTAFFADNDTIALGAIKAFREAGYQIPEDISIIGIDDIPFSAVSSPALTTIRISQRTMGELAVSTLLQCVDARANGIDFPVVKAQIGGQLVCRESTSLVREP